MAENKVRFLRGTAAEYANAVKDEDTFYYTIDGEKLYVGSKEISGGGSITIDSELSDTSENAVQNKVIKADLDKKALKSKYGDTTINIGRLVGSDIGANSTAEGVNTIASGPFSHAEGNSTTASGQSSHAEGDSTTASGEFSHAGGLNTIASGKASHAEGWLTTASGQGSHAEGVSTTASGYYSHAGGSDSTAKSTYSFAYGGHVNANNMNEVAFGVYNVSNTDTLFSIGDGTSSAAHNAFEVTTNGGKLHDKNIATEDDIPVEMTGATSGTNGVSGLVPAPTVDDITKFLCGNGTWKEMSGGSITIDNALSDTSENAVQNKIIKADLDKKASKALYGDTTINVGRKADTTVGVYSTAEGYRTTASGQSSHAEGSITIASGPFSHAEGDRTTASGQSSHAEGVITTASGYYSHAEGISTTASDSYSHAEGSYTTASSLSSHAEGSYTTASNAASHASGRYNATMTGGGSEANTTGTAFVIGNGTKSGGTPTLSNAFSVQFDGTVKAKSTITAQTTADYAEFFEWLDGNPNDEDRVGYFITLDGDKIRIAAADDYILGVVSGEPFVLGNGDCDTWNGMFLRDEFRRTIFEPAPKVVEILDSEGRPTGEYKEVEGEFEGTRPKLNPEYDPTQEYISRFERKEWAPVGMLGVLAVRHDGTAAVNGYVTVNAEGIATACEKNIENAYRVIKKATDSVVEIIFR